MKILALVPAVYDTSPGQRFRMEQWEPLLRKAGVEITWAAFEVLYDSPEKEKVDNGELDGRLLRRRVLESMRNVKSELLIVTPYYIRPPQRGLVAYYLELMAGHDVPWMIYHIPGRTAVSVTLDTLKECRDKSPTFCGIKHAVNDLGFASECLHELGADFKVFAGLEELSFPMLTVGACGLMNAVGNLQPAVLAQLCEAVLANDLATGRELHDRLLEINKAVFYDTNPIPIKYMMMKLGLLAKNEHRLPMVPATAELATKLDGVLERAGLAAPAAGASTRRRASAR